MSESHISTLTIKGEEYNIGGEQFDDNWIYVYEPIVTSGGTFTVGDIKYYSLENIIPDDGHDYEIQITAWAQSGNTSGNSVYLRIHSGIATATATSFFYTLNGITRSSYRTKKLRTVEIPLYANDRFLTVYCATGSDIYNWGLTLVAYKRLGKKKKDKNFIVSHSININNYYASNFKAARNIQIPYKLNNNAEYVVKFTLPNTTYDTQQGILGGTNFCSLYVQGSSYSVAWYNQNTAEYASIFIGVPNGTYWVKMKVSGNNVTYSYSEDGVNYQGDVTITDAIDTTIAEPLFIGDTRSNSNPFYGTIDLTETYININGKRFWSAVETPIEKRVNAIPVGDIWLQDDIGRNFGLENYFVMPKKFNPGNNTWEMIWKVRTPDTAPSHTTTIIGAYGLTSGNSPVIQVTSNSTFNICIPGTGGGSWLIDNIHGTYTVQLDTIYYVKLYYTGTHYKLDYSLDGVNYINDISVEESTPIYAATSPFVIGNHKYNATAERDWLGLIYFDGCYIKIDDETWWEGVTYNNVKDELDVERFALPVEEPQINGIIHGNPKIEGSVVSNFSRENFVRVHEGSYNDEYVVKFTIPSLSSITTFDLWQTVVSSNQIFQILVNFTQSTGAYDIRIFKPGADTHVTLIQGSSYETTYWVKQYVEGDNVYASYSTDGVNYSEPISLGSWKYHEDCYVSFGMHFQPCTAAARYPFEGSIDFSECYIKHNNEIIWEGYKNIKNLEVGGDFLPGFPSGKNGLGNRLLIYDSAGPSTAGGTMTFDLSTILPVDEYDYEIYLTIYGRSPATAGASLELSAGSGSNPTNYINVGSIVNDAAKYENAMGSLRLVIHNDDRAFTVKASAVPSNMTIYLHYYRRCPKVNNEDLLSTINTHSIDGNFADGNWVINPIQIVSAETLKSTATATYSLSDIHFDKVGVYELIVSVSVIAPTQNSGAYIFVSGINNERVFVAGCIPRTSSSKSDQSMAHIFIYATSTATKSITAYNAGAAATGNYYLNILAYRYIGTNY